MQVFTTELIYEMLLSMNKKTFGSFYVSAALPQHPHASNLLCASIWVSSKSRATTMANKVINLQYKVTILLWKSMPFEHILWQPTLL
jgi:hypothetical protein